MHAGRLRGWGRRGVAAAPSYGNRSPVSADDNVAHGLLSQPSSRSPAHGNRSEPPASVRRLRTDTDAPDSQLLPDFRCWLLWCAPRL